MKKTLFILMTAAVLLSLGCGRSEQAYKAYNDSISADQAVAMRSASSIAWEGTGYEPDSSPAAAPARNRDVSLAAPGGSGATLPENYERKLVKSAYIRIRAENLEAADRAIEQKLKQYDAYSASTTADENSRYYSLRVPAHFYEAFLADMDGMGRILDRSENTEDVTLRYYDLEGRLSTKRELLRTYQSYLGRAANIEEILKVEAKISELQYDIELTGIQLRNLANQVDYATIELRILGPVAAAVRQGETIGERVNRLFGGFGGFLSVVAVGFLGFVIYGIPIIAIIVLLFWLLFGKVGLARKLWGVIKK